MTLSHAIMIIALSHCQWIVWTTEQACIHNFFPGEGWGWGMGEPPTLKKGSWRVGCLGEKGHCYVVSYLFYLSSFNNRTLWKGDLQVLPMRDGADRVRERWEMRGREGEVKGREKGEEGEAGGRRGVGGGRRGAGGGRGENFKIWTFKVFHSSNDHIKPPVVL